MQATDLQTGCRVQANDVRRMGKFDWSMFTGWFICLILMGFFWAAIVWGVVKLCRKLS